VPPRRTTEELCRTSPKIGARGEAALERDVREPESLRPRHQEERALEPHARHEVVERLAHHGAKDAMEVVGRKARDLGHLLELERLAEVPRHVVDGAVHPLDVVDGGRALNRKI